MSEQLDNSIAVAISCDAWKSTSNESHLGVTDHIIDDDINIKNIVLYLRYLTEDNSAEYIFSTIKDILEEWNVFNKVNKCDLKNLIHDKLLFNLLISLL